MSTYLITGCAGFVAQHFINFLQKENNTIVGIDILEKINTEKLNIIYEKDDMLSEKSIERLLIKYAPEYIIHCASISSVGLSWNAPVQTFVNNTNIFLNLIESVRKLKLSSKVLSIGSSEQYGNLPSLPFREDMPPCPSNPYAVARASQEMLSKLYADSYGLRIYMTRSFNHFGPGQSDNFVISSFVKQLVEIAYKKRDNTLYVGNISVERDFLDVRDVISAYNKILKQASVGCIYNVCSGKSTSLHNIITLTAQLLGITVNIKVDEKRLRPNEVLRIYGDNNKIKNELDWKPQYTFESTLKDIISYWEKNI